MKKRISTTKKIAMGLLLSLTLCHSFSASAGVALGATRVIYPATQKQVPLAVTNNDDKSTYLIQSWIENQDGQKDNRFVLTPPLFTMQGKKENTLRIIDATNQQLPKDRESLFWINVKAIPAMDKANSNMNTLQLAIISKIKLYYRPDNLSMPVDQAAKHLRFSRSGDQLTFINPTPYYLTVTETTVGKQAVDNTLVPPFKSTAIKLPGSVSGEISYRTINDYGSVTEKMKGILQ